MIVAIILWASIIWVAPFLYFMLVNEAKFKKNIVVGVTLPYEAREDEQVKAALSCFKKRLKWISIALVAIAIPCFFIRSFKVLFTLWCIWNDLCVVLPNIPYVQCNSALKKIKMEKGWRRSGNQCTIVDTAAIPSGRWLSPWLFLPAVALSLVPFIWDRSFWMLYITFAICSVFFWFCYRYLYRNKSEMVDENAELSRVLTQVRRHNWGNMWIVCAYSFAVISLTSYFTRNSPILSIGLMVAITFVICMAVVRIELNTRKIQEKLTAESGKSWYVDDDDKWIGGIIYYNPNDSHLIINNRVGTNSSVNLAKTSGKILMGLVALILVAMPFTGVFIDASGAKPINLQLTDSAVISSRAKVEYTVPYEEIADVQLLEELPKNMVRTFGTGMENLLKGDFNASGIGSMKVCLDPNYAPFILITTDRGQNYLFGCRDGELTKQVYEQLENQYLNR